MSTAQDIIQDAYDSIGRGSELLDTDSSLLDKGLKYLRSRMEFLRKKGVILEETVSSVTTTIALPDALTDELDEPVAATVDLTNYLAVYIAAQSRIDISSFAVPPASFSFRNLASLYRVHTIPNKVPSKFLPMGQGSDRLSTFFSGQALDDDATS
jgi:hypothetical protein